MIVQIATYFAIGWALLSAAAAIAIIVIATRAPPD
jgi:hypothetical protein